MAAMPLPRSALARPWWTFGGRPPPPCARSTALSRTSAGHGQCGCVRGARGRFGRAGRRAGDDRWGHWLQARLDAERIDSSEFTLLDGISTQLAFVSVDASGEPTYELYGDRCSRWSGRSAIASTGWSTRPRACSSAPTRWRASPSEKLTMRARDRAVAQGRPVVFDCNLRLHRWSSRSDAAASANACVPGATLVHANLDEAELLTGEHDPERAALALRKAGAELVVYQSRLTRGAAAGRGRVARRCARAPHAGGEHDRRRRRPYRDAAGEVGVERVLSGGGAAALDEAMAAGAAACQRWGSLD